jgi:hypothetical protein
MCFLLKVLVFCRFTESFYLSDQVVSIANFALAADFQDLATSKVSREQVAAFRLLLNDPRTALDRVVIPKRHRKARGNSTSHDPMFIRSCLLGLQLHLRLSYNAWLPPGNADADFVWSVVCDLLEFWWNSIWLWADGGGVEAEDCRRQSVHCALNWPSQFEDFLQHLTSSFSH